MSMIVSAHEEYNETTPLSAILNSNSSAKVPPPHAKRSDHTGTDARLSIDFTSASGYIPLHSTLDFPFSEVYAVKNILLSPLSAVLILILVAGCGTSKKPGGPSALYTVKKAAAAPVVDGVLDDVCWKDLPALEFVLLNGGGKPKHPTSARMVYDDKNLYVGFECQDLDAASTVAEFDGPVLTDGDFVSILIEAGSDTTSYFLIAAAPTGAVEDAFVLNGGNSAKLRVLNTWNCERLRASVAVYGAGAQPGNEDRFWTVEMAIPFSEMVTAPHRVISGA